MDKKRCIHISQFLYDHHHDVPGQLVAPEPFPVEPNTNVVFMKVTDDPKAFSTAGYKSANELGNDSVHIVFPGDIDHGTELGTVRAVMVPVGVNNDCAVAGGVYVL